MYGTVVKILATKNSGYEKNDETFSGHFLLGHPV